mgnify:CR=1 FL=1
MHPTARFIVCEKKPVWAAAFRRASRDAPIEVCESRSLADVVIRLSESPNSVVGLDAVSLGVRHVGQWLADVGRQYREARLVVLGSRELKPVQWQLRELGACHFVPSTRELRGVLDIVRRNLEIAPANRLDWRRELFERLPWKDMASDRVNKQSNS